jgi:DNA-binding IclR family transcriptional regulator
MISEVPKVPGEVQSVRRALTLLRQFTPRNPVWAIGELSKATGLHKSVVTRLMATMASEGFVVQRHSDRKYIIGPEAFAVGSLFEPYHLLHQVTRPIMDQLTERCRHSTCLGIPAGDHFMIIDTFESNSSIRVAFEIGERPHYHGAAIGKLLLASLPWNEVLDLVGPEPMAAITPHTIRTHKALQRELHEIRTAGFARSREESIFGVGAVAAAIVNRENVAIAGISIVYPVHIVDEAEIAAMSELVKEAAREGSRQLAPLLSALPHGERDPDRLRMFRS